jgi:hypothetical protein
VTRVPPDHEYFFAVGSPQTVTSTVWKIWAWPGKTDVYVTEKGLTNSLKVSLHQSGDYRVAFSRRFVQQEKAAGKWKRKKRETDEWTATFIQPGIQLPFRMLIPASELRLVGQGWTSQKPIDWLPTPPDACGEEFGLFLAGAGFPLPGYLQTDGRDGIHRWVRPLTSSVTLYVLSKTVPISDAIRSQIETARHTAQRILRASPGLAVGPEERIRTLAFGSTPDGARFIIDVAAD